MVVNSWRTTTIGELCTGIYDGPHATPKKTSSGPIFLGISNLSLGRVNLSSVEHLSEDDFIRWTRRITPRANDVVFSYETRLGEAALIPEGLKCCLGRRMALMRPNTSKVEPRFLLYAYLSPGFQETIRSRTVHGSTVNRISLTEFPSYPILVPEIPEQRAIAHILGTLDDKIELNQQMNRNLEAIASAIFKSWFVDFDPVRAKMEGRQPAGMDAATAALFPDSFEDSPLGKVPKGWLVEKIARLVNISREGLNVSNYSDEIFDYYSIPAFDEGRIPKTEIGVNINSSKFIVSAKAVLLSKLNPHIPRVWLPAIAKTRRSVCSTEFLVTLPVSRISREYLYALFSSQSFLEVFKTLVTGTSGSHQRVKPEYLLSMEIVVPNQSIIDRFTELVSPLYEQIQQNLFESRSLATIRDTLLPKLISGEIRVKEAEKILEDVA